MTRSWHWLACPVAVLALSLHARGAAAASCEALGEMSFPNTTITRAVTVPAGAFAPPATAAPARGANPAPAGGGGGRGGAAASFADLPAFCRVIGTAKTSATSSVTFEVWMPAAERWNGNFRADGFAFYGGTMAPGVLAAALREGYATATTDAGGDGTNGAAFMMNNPEKVADWNERAWHETTLRAKALVTAFYGRGPAVSYWNACGGGTRQGLKEIARFPADYDALAAGGLSHDTTHFTFAQIWQWEVTHKDPASLLTADKLQVLHRGALAACDAKDGMADGIIQDPEHCAFDPVVLQCKSGDGPDCLTAAQVEAARKTYAPVVNPRTKAVISGPLMRGSELSWNARPSDAPTGFGADFFKYLVFQDAGWDYRTRPINYDSDVALANRPGLAEISAIEPDLRPFLNRGGKILFYGGWSDNAIPPLDAVTYYKRILEKSGTAAKDAVRLFMIPDMGHCPANPGAAAGYVFDPVPVITQWKEQGKTPQQIVVAHRQNGADDRTTLVCPYPQLATYRGTGSMTDASNFVCKAR